VSMLRAAMSFLLVSSCATGSIPRVPGDPAPAVTGIDAEATYQTVLDKYTRSMAIYDHLDIRMFVRATVQSPEFSRARLEREAVFKSIPESEIKTRLTQEQLRLNAGAEIFLGVHANEPKHDDFNRANSMWRIALVIDGREVTPSSVERVGRVNTEMRSYYSYMESFWVGYRLRFEGVVLPEGRPYSLKLASAVGQAQLNF
jgi:hypothetical protein